jgi:hypothetical protein
MSTATSLAGDSNFAILSVIYLEGVYECLRNRAHILVINHCNVIFLKLPDFEVSVCSGYCLD